MKNEKEVIILEKRVANVTQQLNLSLTAGVQVDLTQFREETNRFWEESNRLRTEAENEQVHKQIPSWFGSRKSVQKGSPDEQVHKQIPS